MSDGKIDFGVIVEGVVEIDSMTGRYLIRTTDQNDRPIGIDVQKALESYKGQQVRFILTPFETIEKLAQLAEQAQEEVKVEPD
jgi:hypothetical protein